ncbi:MAG TPA: NADH-quinone oxidoreductase subunit M [Candidatus Eremiobacteraceae bacterium]|nr:NADH-quinone oxidoreductase subunit M [Candidatus Eremiobacteraceae bacterium]
MMIDLVVFLPAIAALALFCIPRYAHGALKGVALTGALATFALSLSFVANGFGNDFDQWVPWISGTWTAAYHVHIGGLSVYFVLLTTLVSVAATWGAFSYADAGKLRGFLALLLLFETTLLGLFTAADLLLFYVYWDLMLIPVFLLLVGYSGSAEARSAAWSYLLYNGAGGLILLLGVVGVVLHTGTFEVLGQTYSFGSLENWLFAAFALAFLIKTPSFPFHSWMPPTYTNSPPPLVAMVSGVQSKAGLFGFLVFALPMFPDAARTWAPVLLVLAVASIVYGAFAALGQRDMKTLVAFSSLSHLGLVVLALFAFDLTSVPGSVVMIVSHGLISAALFLLLGFVEERTGSREIGAFGGLAAHAPRLQALMLVVAMALLGLPGLSGFAGEFLILIGAWQTQPIYTAISLIAIVVASAYALKLFQGVMHGPDSVPGGRTYGDLRAREIWILAPLVAGIFLLGIWPGVLLPSGASVAGAIHSRAVALHGQRPHA